MRQYHRGSPVQSPMESSRHWWLQQSPRLTRWCGARLVVAKVPVGAFDTATWLNLSYRTWDWRAASNGTDHPTTGASGVR
jgi:hypothetical protein